MLADVIRTARFLLFLAPFVVASKVHATEGYWQHAYGARHKALAGAGVAYGIDASSALVNPALMSGLPSQTSLALSAFLPSLGMVGSGTPGFTPTGRVDSADKVILIPNMSVNWRVHSNAFFDAMALSIYGNGLATSYPAIARPFVECGGGSGVFCGGKAGVALKQMGISVTFAKTIAPGLSIGVAPTFVRQQFEAIGLDTITIPSAGTDVSFGYGVGAGLQWKISPQLRAGLSLTSRTAMTPFSKYSGLFAQHGDLDIPASLQAGVAFDIANDLTVMIDYKKIWLSSINAIGNPSTNILTGARFGDVDGPGFGWSNVEALKIGLEWRALPGLILRGGYAVNNSPISGRDVQFNILAPGTSKQHFTTGAAISLSRVMDLEFALMYSPKHIVSGYEVLGNPAHKVEISMEQWEITVGMKYKFE